VTNYFDLVEATLTRLADALDKGEYKKADRLTRALRSMISRLHSAQHKMGSHLPIDVRQLESILEIFEVKEEGEA